MYFGPHKVLMFASGRMIAWVYLNLIREFVLRAGSHPILDMFSKKYSDSLNHSCFLTEKPWVNCF